MKLGRITRRWLLNTTLVATVLVVLLTGIAIHFVRAAYYNSVQTTLRLKDGESISTYFNVNDGTGDALFNETAREFIEQFGDKDIMSVWIINTDQRVILSSNGFYDSDTSKFGDYQTALKNGESAFSICKLESGEKVYAMTAPIHLSGGTAAIRYLISLEDVDAQLRVLDILIVLAGLLVIALITVPGTLFIQSTAKSIREISEAAGQIAAGKLDTRVQKGKHKDEIGDLCNSINNMAEEISNADKLKNDFISTISHELRTPLTAIKGWGETITDQGGSDPDLMGRGLKVIISESERLTALVEELLDFSRMQSGKLSLRIEKIDVLAELDETVFSFKERALREGKDLRYNAIDLPAPMDADPNRIKQVFVNVLDNALKYTTQGGEILVEAKLKTPTVLEITVSDTGNGISKEDLPHVKERFFKADMSARGSGIGLAVVDEIVRLHKGEWKINSVLGQGTTVTILLPVEEIELPPAQPIIPPEERGTYEQEDNS